MEWRIETLPLKKLVGKKMLMTLSNNKTFELWRSFMPRRKEVLNTLGTNLYSLQVYDLLPDFQDFNPETVFVKWALIEVSDFGILPPEMECYTLAGGLYVVFNHKGHPNTFPDTFNYIFKTWLPGSAYSLDNRAHFELLGEKYKNDQQDSEEEVWIPIKPKK